MLPGPSDITFVSDQTLLVYFDDETEADTHEICLAIDLLSPLQVLSWEDIEGDIYYQQWKGGENALIYAPQGLDNLEDDQKYNRILSERDRRTLDRLNAEPARALAYLAEAHK